MCLLDVKSWIVIVKRGIIQIWVGLDANGKQIAIVLKRRTKIAIINDNGIEIAIINERVKIAITKIAKINDNGKVTVIILMQKRQ